MSALDRFEFFVHVAQAGSLTAAANNLHITKAALSKQIKKLEEEIQVDLFMRSGQRLAITEQGQLLLEQCIRLHKELLLTQAMCKQFYDEPEGALHIVIGDYFADKVLFPKLAGFLQLYPKLDIVIDIDERFPEFESAKVDLAIGFVATPGDDIVRKKIYSTRRVLCGSAEYLARYGTPVTLSELSQHKFICHTNRVKYNQPLIFNKPLKVNIKPSIVLNKVTAMITCALSGLGLVQLPLYALEQFLETNQLIEVLPEHQVMDSAMYYYYPRHRYTQPKVRKFIDYFLSSDLIDEE